MAWKSQLIKPFAKSISRQVSFAAKNPLLFQENIFKSLIKTAKTTAFGKDHSFDKIKNYYNYKIHVPIRDYEKLKPYINRIKDQEQNVLWPGLPKYLAKTSGTTSGVKYIPITKASLPNHFNSARNALFHFANQTGQFDFLDGKMIFLSGSPALERMGKIRVGRLSGIVNHQVPTWLIKNQVPSYKTNCIEDWEEKLDHIVDETFNKDLRLISGIPPWVVMYFEQLLEKTQQSTIREVFPNMNLFVYGGVNYAPYRSKIESLIGESIQSIETYPASEGFIAFQDRAGSDELLLNVNSGIYFEFVPASEIFDENPSRIPLEGVEIGVNYAILLTTNAGLWSYNIGDTVIFTDTNPYRLKVSGRIKHFISAFGEHVIGKEIDEALSAAISQFDLKIIEYTVAPQVNPGNGETPFHEWFIAFDEIPAQLSRVSAVVDQQLQKANIYYKDLRKGNILQQLQITPLSKDAFIKHMQSKGKLGGQNKVPRLSNDRDIAEALGAFRLEESIGE